MNDLEAATIEAFFLPSKRQRYLTLLGTPKRRAKALHEFNHLRHLDPRFSYALDSKTNVAEVLFRYGAPRTCRPIASDPEYDGIEQPLEQAMEWIELNRRGTLVCCVAGRLAYSYGEDGEERSLLVR